MGETTLKRIYTKFLTLPTVNINSTKEGICNIIHIVNDYHSRQELLLKKGWITPQIKSAIRSFPVVVITGARQVGKSTLLQNKFKEFKYISLDNFSMLQQAKTDPASLWIDTDHLIIDEAQKAPELFAAIKMTIDAAKGKN